MRLFVAIDLPNKIKSELAVISFGLPQARWVPLEQPHLTLRFIVLNFHLYSSILTPKGALHRHEAEYLLSRRHILGSG